MWADCHSLAGERIACLQLSLLDSQPVDYGPAIQSALDQILSSEDRSDPVALVLPSGEQFYKDTFPDTVRLLGAGRDLVGRRVRATQDQDRIRAEEERLCNMSQAFIIRVPPQVPNQPIALHWTQTAIREHLAAMEEPLYCHACALWLDGPSQLEDHLQCAKHRGNARQCTLANYDRGWAPS